MITKTRKNREELRRVLELRRSNCATAIPSKKVYTRKKKHANKLD